MYFTLLIDPYIYCWRFKSFIILFNSFVLNTYIFLLIDVSLFRHLCKSRRGDMASDTLHDMFMIK